MTPNDVLCLQALKHTCTHMCACIHPLGTPINYLVNQKYNIKKRIKISRRKILLLVFICLAFWIFLIILNKHYKKILIFKGHSLVFFKLTFQTWFTFCKVFSFCERNSSPQSTLGQCNDLLERPWASCT